MDDTTGETREQRDARLERLGTRAALWTIPILLVCGTVAVVFDIPLCSTRPARRAGPGCDPGGVLPTLVFVLLVLSPLVVAVWSTVRRR